MSDCVRRWSLGCLGLGGRGARTGTGVGLARPACDEATRREGMEAEAAAVGLTGLAIWPFVRLRDGTRAGDSYSEPGKGNAFVGCSLAV